ncbi:unnamed protein product [Mytilus coruscus]|uniref:Uncharacterized protein n=1 Tax=Mytilus coruscus TaxID=42192 RepID=A0A6J8AXU5_MYTCO|nr:unnamed protein product [Mytilus coruscus]
MYTTFEREPENTSTHDPVLVLLQGAIPKEDPQNLRRQTNMTKRIIWKKIDKQKYAKDDEIVNTDPEIREAWADYFYDLATPSENPNFDPIFKDNVEKDVQNLHKYFSEENQHNIEHVSTDMVEKTILSFKNGKSPDELNISAEHLKYGGSLLISVLAFIINFLFKHVHIPALIKSGIVCPVLKNGGKPKDDPNSYRRITITSSVGKVVEKIHLSRNEDKILAGMIPAVFKWVP